MRRIFALRLGVGMLVSIMGLAAVAGCTGKSDIQANLGESFSLAAGQSAAISGENLSIRFVELISDSRCPQGAVCIWEGEASSIVDITYSGEVNRKMLVQPGITSFTDTNFGVYTISFQVNPYPEVGKDIKTQDYRLKLIISK